MGLVILTFAVLLAGIQILSSESSWIKEAEELRAPVEIQQTLASDSTPQN